MFISGELNSPTNNMEWKTVKLGEICDLIMNREKGVLIDKSNYVSTENMLPNKGGVVPSSITPYNGAIIYHPKDVLMSNIRPYFKKIWFADKVGGCSGDVLCFRSNSKIDSTYLYYLLSQDLFFDYVMAGSKGTKMPRGDKGQIMQYEFLLPPLETQRRIAAILSSLDDKIENNNRINRNLEAQAQALFKSWFVDFEPFGGSVPNDWKERTLEEICTQLKEKVGNRDDVKVLSPVTTGKLMLSEEYFSKQVFSQSIAKYIVVPPTAFAYNPARVNIGSLGMNEFDFDGCVSPVYVVFECRDGYEYFFDLFRRTNQFKEEVKSRAIGGVRQTLGYDDFKRIQTVIPPKEIVDEFNKIYAAMLDVSDANKRENLRLAALRDTLLPKLMKGEIEV